MILEKLFKVVQKMSGENYDISSINLAKLFNKSTSNQYDKEAIIDQTYAKTQLDENRIDAEAKVIKDRGVYRVEASKELMDNSKNGKLMKAVLGISIVMCAWAVDLDSSVTYSLAPWATSHYQKHSEGLGALTTANGIIAAISKPVYAQICNTLSRPTTYVISVVLYTVGYIIVAASNTFSAYIVGLALGAAGTSGIRFINSLIAADLTVLKWRSLATAILSAPYIINTWYAGYIVQDLGTSNWRWGYGMFTIIMPVVVCPATYILIFSQQKAHKLIPEDDRALYEQLFSFRKNWKTFIWRLIIEADVLGLLLLGFGFALLLLPFSLQSGAKGGWNNPSMIAMMVIGGVLVIVFFLWEILLAPFPITPRRVLNRTVICCIVIDFFYQFAGMLPLQYLSSYVWIVQNWSNRDWTYYNNTLTVALCVFGLVAGVLYRVTHRYKVFQIFGVLLETVSQGFMINGTEARTDTLLLVWHSICSGAAGGFNVVASATALLAAVPHRDLAVAMSILSLWSLIGQSIGGAVSTAIWGLKMESEFRKYLPSSVSDEQVTGYFHSITAIREDFDWGSDERDGAIKAYKVICYYFFAIAAALQVIRFVAVMLQTNYYLGDTQNAVEFSDETQISNEVERRNVEKSNQNWYVALYDIW